MITKDNEVHVTIRLLWKTIKNQHRKSKKNKKQHKKKFFEKLFTKTTLTNNAYIEPCCKKQ